MKITYEDDNDDDDDDDDDSCDGVDQPLYLIPVEGEGVHRVEADRAIILCHNVLQCVTMCYNVLQCHKRAIILCHNVFHAFLLPIGTKANNLQLYITLLSLKNLSPEQPRRRLKGSQAVGPLRPTDHPLLRPTTPNPVT